MLVVEHRARLAKQRKRLGGELEPDHMRASLWIRRIVRPIAGPMTGDEIFDLAKVLADRRCDPRCLGRGRRDAGQLTHRRERQLVTGKRRGEPGQATERPRYPQPILGGARCIVQRALEIVQRGHHAERPPDLQCLGLAEPVHLLSIERGAAASDRPQRAIHGAPVPRCFPWNVRRPCEHLFHPHHHFLGSFAQHDQSPARVCAPSSTRVFDVLVCDLRDDLPPSSET
ncbi:MAG: hypothetical protein E6J91_38155 [Deltaproteobacteria bacterium]|nr:MAG: hypothetical protein E6J91_38155 [Deltaproteobacteria bacterium]